MRHTMRNVGLALLALSAACSVKLPEGKFKCSSDDDCPSDWVCADSLCYSERPGGGDAGSSNGTDAGKPDAGGDDFDAGINTTDCDAFTTFYRDSDDDGLGVASQSVAACSVMNGYVTNQDDCNDMCTACTKADAQEICDGFDNDCNGKTDDGQLKFATRISFESMPAGKWAEVVQTDDGAVFFSSVFDGELGSIRAQRIDGKGALLGDAVAIEGATPGPKSYNLAADQLNGKIVLSWFEQDGIKASVLKASDLSVLVAETSISSGIRYTLALDVALSTSASGGRVLFAFEQEHSIRVHPFRLSDLTAEVVEPVTIYTAADPGNGYPMVTLAAGPCLSGFYAAVNDGFLRVLRIVPLGDDGNPSGTSYDVPMAGDLYFPALPALRVEGGDCDTPPTRLVLAYAIEEEIIGAETSDVHLDYLTISREDGLDSLSLADAANFEQTGSVLLSFIFAPGSGAFVYAWRAIDLIAYEGRYLVAVATADSYTADKAGLAVAEIDGHTVVAKYAATDIQPVGPKSLQLAVVQGVPWLATSSWSNNDPAGLLRIGCAP